MVRVTAMFNVVEFVQNILLIFAAFFNSLWSWLPGWFAA